MQSKIIVVIGPTASGKSEYAVKLAKKYNGEIISADSRQVYRGLNIGTGKVAGHWARTSSNFPYPRGRTNTNDGSLSVVVSSGSPPKIGEKRWPQSLADKLVRARGGMNLDKIFIYKGIVHHCIDFVPPKKQYSVADFKRDGTKALLDILARGRTPIICGGTGQFVDALILDTPIPAVPPDKKFRKLMEKKSTAKLFKMLQKKDPMRAANIDPHNPRRLIRALEIIHLTGKPVPEISKHTNIETLKHKDQDTQIPLSVIPEFSALRKYPESSSKAKHGFRVKPGMTQIQIPTKIHYLNPPREQLYKRIEKRLQERLVSGMVTEVKKLHTQGVSWRRMEDLGLEYRYVSRYVRGSITYNEMYTQLLSEIKKYSKRQQTWFRKYQS